MRTIGLILAMLLPAMAPATNIEELLRGNLDPLGGGPPSAPADYLGGNALLCLVLWDSRCPDCLEDVAELAATDPPEGVRLLGVNFDATPWDAREFIAERGTNFPQLYDPEARLALALDADRYSFSFALLDETGTILALHYDSVDDAAEALREAVEAVRFASPVSKPATESVGRAGSETAPEQDAGGSFRRVASSRRYPFIHGSGRVRTRLLSVAVSGEEPEGDCHCSVTGPYGESLVVEKNLLYRLSYELVAELAPGLRAGGELRVSDEDPALLEQGPEYLGNPIGSAFAEWRAAGFAVRGGYFTENFTPLTLQRWDFEDNPPASGSGGAGCAVCGASLRGLSLEALDDLEPGITFEGLRLEAMPLPGLRATGFYAIPRRAVASSGTTTDNPFAYRLDLLGLRLRYRFAFGGRSGGELSLQELTANEDAESSILPPSWSHLPMSFIHKNEVWSGALRLPMPADIVARAEAAHGFGRVDSLDGPGEGVADPAYIVKISRRFQPGWSASAAWQRLGPHFTSPFRALSYQSNLQGLRLSARWTGRRGGLAAFFKSLRRVEDAPGSDAPDRSKVLSALIGWKPREALSLDVVGVLVREERDDVEDCRCDRRTLTLTARGKLAPKTELMADLSFLGAGPADANDPQQALIATLQFTADF